MARAAQEPEGLFARRLDLLMRTVHPAGRKPYSNAEVADALNTAAGEQVVGTTYIWQLRKGLKDNPTYKVVTGLARLFGVPPQYFFDDAETGRGAVPPEVAAALTDDRVRGITLGVSGLSEHSLAAVEQLIASVRALEDQPRGTARPKKKK
ncbi:MAG: helix-turn-helix domain-containing protein [Trebonia sp.]